MDMMDGLLAVNSEVTINFFFSGLKRFVQPRVTFDETLYAASVLASYAQTSREAWITPSPGNLSEVFDRFVLADEGGNDSEILAIAGAECLLLVGFFRDQVRRRHNVRLYDQLGCSFFRRASRHSTGKESGIYGRLALNFPPLALACRDLSRDLRDNLDNRYLLKYEP